MEVMAVSGLFETIREFTNRWFSESADIVVGVLRPNTHYIVKDYESNEVADIIIDMDGVRYYLYEVFYPSDYYYENEAIDVEFL